MEKLINFKLLIAFFTKERKVQKVYSIIRMFIPLKFVKFFHVLRDIFKSISIMLADHVFLVSYVAIVKVNFRVLGYVNDFYFDHIKKTFTVQGRFP